MDKDKEDAYWRKISILKPFQLALEKKDVLKKLELIKEMESNYYFKKELEESEH